MCRCFPQVQDTLKLRRLCWSRSSWSACIHCESFCPLEWTFHVILARRCSWDAQYVVILPRHLLLQRQCLVTFNYLLKGSRSRTCRVFPHTMRVKIVNGRSSCELDYGVSCHIWSAIIVFCIFMVALSTGMHVWRLIFFASSVTWKVQSSAQPIQPWSEQNPTLIWPSTGSRQPTVCLGFLHASQIILYGETLRFVDRLPFKAMRPNVAPATASDKPRSTNTTRATNSYRTTSSSIAVATKPLFLSFVFLSYFFLVDSSFRVPSFTWLFLYCSCFSFTGPFFIWQFLSCSFFYLTVPLLFLFFLHCSFLYLTVPFVFLSLLGC